MAKIDTLFMTKTILFGAVHTHIVHIREYPPPRVISAQQKRPKTFYYPGPVFGFKESTLAQGKGG